MYRSAPKGELKKAQFQSATPIAQYDLVVPHSGQGYPVNCRKVHCLKGMSSNATRWGKLRADTEPRTISNRETDRPSLRVL
jgi:hypothetical protein